MSALRRPLLLFASLLVAGLLASAPVFAQSTSATGCVGLSFIPAVGIPGSPFQANQSTTVDCSSIGTYIKAIYVFAVYAASIAAAIMIMVGGFLWVTAGGNVNQVGTARTYIGGALSGFILILLSYTLLQTINPNLVRFKSIEIKPIDSVPATAFTDCQAVSEGTDLSNGGTTGWVRSDSGSCPAISSGQVCWCNKTAEKQAAQASQFKCCYNQVSPVSQHKNCGTSICLLAPSEVGGNAICPTGGQSSPIEKIVPTSGTCSNPSVLPAAPPLCSSCPSF